MQVIYGANANYVLPALVSIYSLWKHASQSVGVTLYVEDINEDSLDMIRRASEGCGLPIQVKDFDVTGFEEYSQSKAGYPAVSLLPLILPRLVDGRCLFIDADTLVMGDVWELLTANLDGMPIGACTDVGQVTLEDKLFKMQASDLFQPSRAQIKRRNHVNRILSLGFIPGENYFNSGVLVMDCDTVRNNFPNHVDLASMDKLSPYIHNLHSLPDQDRLNEFFAGQWFRIPLKWNTRPGIVKDVEKRKHKFRYISEDLRTQMQEAAASPKLWHFMGGKKPWIKRWRTLLKFRQAYRDYTNTCRDFNAATGIVFGI